MTNADLSQAIFISSTLDGVILTGANLHLADLRFADLSDVNLSGMNLSGTDLSESNLAGANLEWLGPDRAILRESNLAAPVCPDPS